MGHLVAAIGAGIWATGEKYNSGLVTVVEVFRTGAFTHDSGREGVPHAFEQMLFKKYRGEGTRTWSEALSDMHADRYNGLATDERVSYYVVVPAKEAEVAMPAVAELVRDPEFSDGDLVFGRQFVFDELERDFSGLGSHLSNASGPGARWIRGGHVGVMAVRSRG